MREEEFYDEVYTDSQSLPIIKQYIKYSHEALEKKINHKYSKVLELGCNKGEHSEYVKHPYDEYLLSDYRNTNPKLNNRKMRFQIIDATCIPYADNSFDRVIVTCLLHHISNPIVSIYEILRVTKNNGLISILLPTDPGYLYRFAKFIGTDRFWKYKGIRNPRLEHYLQHVNGFYHLNIYIQEVFKANKIRKKFYPFKIRSHNLNLFVVYQIKVKKANGDTSVPE